MNELLSPDQMGQADKLTIEAGVPGIDLMEVAGAAVADVAVREFPDAQKILVVSGTGNNAGDGFIAARILAQSGLHVDIHIVGDEDRVRGDAALAKKMLPMIVATVADLSLDQYDLIIDAIFGAGLDRDVHGSAASVIEAINASDVPVLAVDLPSGIDGATGSVRGVAIKANATVTFFRKKPGHILFPGLEYCGRVFLHQIGIQPSVLELTGVTAFINQSEIWQSVFPKRTTSHNKFNRGHVLVLAGSESMSGAPHRVAGAALKAGAGLVTIAGSNDDLSVNPNQLSSIIPQKAETTVELMNILSDIRFDCIVMGSGLTSDKIPSSSILRILSEHRKTVLDAGALVTFEVDVNSIFSVIKANLEPVILVLDEGEFSKLFTRERHIKSKISRAQLMAKRSGATVVLKGPDTVVASPSGIACVSDNTPTQFAGVESNDELLGIIAGLMAQSMPAYEAAAAAVWMHGEQCA